MESDIFLVRRRVPTVRVLAHGCRTRSAKLICYMTSASTCSYFQYVDNTNRYNI